MDSTIVGIATPLGIGAICIVRLSGALALDIARKLTKVENLKPRYAHLCDISIEIEGKDSKIDEVIVIYFKAPHSYSGEDVVEVHCHGGQVSARVVCEEAIRLGAREAKAGEFTKRAFLNGRIDLSQAEAISALINSHSLQANTALMRQLKGQIQDFTNDVRQKLLELLAIAEASIDYADDVEEDYAMMENKLEFLQNYLANILQDSKIKAPIFEDFSICIAGKPNVGKSSLLNAILKFPRAIVSHVAGTTRDTIEESINIDGVAMRIIDTAGVRECADELEQIGIERTLKAIQASNLIIYVFDISKPLTEDDFEILNLAKTEGKPFLIIGNKIDLGLDSNALNILQESLNTKENLDRRAHNEVILLCANVLDLQSINEGINAITSALKTYISNININQNIILSSSHQIRCLTLALEEIKLARVCVSSENLEIFSLHINECLKHISSITRPYEHSELLDSMFSQFCLGK